MNSSLPPITYSRELLYADDTRQQRARRVRSGADIRIARGAYVESEGWARLSAREQHILLARALSESGRQLPVLSHLTAAAIHGLPVLGQWPREVHAIVGRTPGGRSKSGVVKHAIALDDADVVEFDGLRVTSLARTVVDLAASLSVMGGVVVADRALLVDRFARGSALVDRDALLEVWARMLPFRGHVRALDVLTFAETRAESPLESVSRVTMRTLGVPKPVLQQSFSDAEGWIGDTDFFWPEFNVVGEADGDSKYLDAALRSGRSADQVVLDEKIREDRLRALPKSLVRWRWAVGVNPAFLWARLSRAGLPRGRRWR